MNEELRHTPYLLGYFSIGSTIYDFVVLDNTKESLTQRIEAIIQHASAQNEGGTQSRRILGVPYEDSYMVVTRMEQEAGITIKSDEQRQDYIIGSLYKAEIATTNTKDEFFYILAKSEDDRWE